MSKHTQLLKFTEAVQVLAVWTLREKDIEDPSPNGNRATHELASKCGMRSGALQSEYGSPIQALVSKQVLTRSQDRRRIGLNGTFSDEQLDWLRLAWPLAHDIVHGKKPAKPDGWKPFSLAAITPDKPVGFATQLRQQSPEPEARAAEPSKESDYHEELCKLFEEENSELLGDKRQLLGEVAELRAQVSELKHQLRAAGIKPGEA